MIDLLKINSLQWRNIAVLTGFCFVLLFLGLGKLPFYTRGEPREGLVVWEMYSSGNWVLPEVNGDYIPFKPPLFHWLALLLAHLFGGINEFTLRLPSALLAFAGVLMIYRSGARLWGERAGFVAGVVLITCVEWWQAGIETQVDMTLAFFITAACLYFDFLYHQRDFGLMKSLGLPLLLGLAALAKGPIGFALPCLIFLVYLTFRRDFAFVTKLHPLPTAVVFLLVAGSWYAAASWEGGLAFFFRQIVDENFRTAAGTYGHYQPIYYYLPIFLENTLPWSCFIPPLALFLYQRRRQLEQERLLFPLVWLVTVFVFFTASLGKRGVYILPLYPPTSLLFGAWWQRLEQDSRNDSLARWIGYFVIIASLTALVTIGFFYAVEHGLMDRRLFAGFTKSGHLLRVLSFITELSAATKIYLAFYAAALCCMIWAFFKRNWRFTFAALAVIALAVGGIIKSAVTWPVALQLTLKPFMARVNSTVAANQPLLFYGDPDYGVMFYSHRHIPSFPAEAHELKGPFFLLIWQDDLQELGRRADLKTLDISEGLGPAGRHHLALVKYQPDPTSSYGTEPLSLNCPRHGSAVKAPKPCSSRRNQN